MLELQDRGCHNIGFVSPTHFAPQMARAILIAAEKGLQLPIVYNTNAYDSVEVLRLLDGIVDVYLPDLKYADSDAGFQYSKVRDYKEHARAAIKEMHRQMGDELVFGDDGLLKRGLMIRLLVLPNDIAGIEENLRWIRDELSPKTAISLMAQYYATNKAATDDALYSALAPHLRRRMVPGRLAARRDRNGRRIYAGIRIGVALLPAGFCGCGEAVQGYSGFSMKKIKTRNWNGLTGEIQKGETTKAR